VGGQAVLEGVMMRGASAWAVAVRPAASPDAIDVATFALPAGTADRPWRRWPVVRGVVALGEALRLGLRALAIAADAQRAGEDPELTPGRWAALVAIALAVAVGLFFLVPLALAGLVTDPGSPAFWALEGVLRVLVFLAYLALLSRRAELRRVFAYHGAEHKAIACYEAGAPLEPASAQRFSRLHPRCGTSFLLVVMLVAVVAFAPLGLANWYVLVLARVLGVPLVAGVAFEVVKWAGRHQARPAVRAIVWPGLQLQRLTTREPDEAQLAVAIAALEAVLVAGEPRAEAARDPAPAEVVA
jgi:uncharacterized protein YqhQ